MRVHRAGEGEPFTGLKPAAREFEPVVAAVDRSLVAGTPEGLLALLPEGARAEIAAAFRDALSKKDYKPNDVRAGRGYVEAYIGLLHRAEQLYESPRQGEGGADSAPAARGAHPRAAP